MQAGFRRISDPETVTHFWQWTSQLCPPSPLFLQKPLCPAVWFCFHYTSLVNLAFYFSSMLLNMLCILRWVSICLLGDNTFTWGQWDSWVVTVQAWEPEFPLWDVSWKENKLVNLPWHAHTCTNTHSYNLIVRRRGLERELCQYPQFPRIQYYSLATEDSRLKHAYVQAKHSDS